jgi:hypothetical protein
MPKHIITSDLQAIFDGLDHEVTLVTLKWQTFKGLFSVSQDQCDMLGRVANSFFRVCEMSFIDDTIISLARVTGPAKSVGKDNLCLEQLLLNFDKLAHPGFANEIQELVTMAQSSTDLIQQYRNRRVGHIDLQTFLQTHPQPLPQITVGQIDHALDDVQKVLNAFSEYFFGPTIYYDKIIHTGGADVLVSYLNRGEQGFNEDFERRLLGN